MSGSTGENKLQARTRSVAKPIITRLWDIERLNYDRLPAEGPAILCANHISFLDSAFLMLTLPRNISLTEGRKLVPRITENLRKLPEVEGVITV